MSTPPPGRWGLLAEFASAEALLDAAPARPRGRLRQGRGLFALSGRRPGRGARLRADRASARPRWWARCSAALGAYLLQWYSATLDYPIVVGGRPLHSWPMFVPVTFEMTVLGGALAAVAALFIGSRLPRLHHPLFAAPDFELASRNASSSACAATTRRSRADERAPFWPASHPLRQSEVPRMSARRRPAGARHRRDLPPCARRPRAGRAASRRFATCTTSRSRRRRPARRSLPTASRPGRRRRTRCRSPSAKPPRIRAAARGRAELARLDAADARQALPATVDAARLRARPRALHDLLRALPRQRRDRRRRRSCSAVSRRRPPTSRLACAPRPTVTSSTS